MSGRTVLLVTHPGRPAAVSLARQAAGGGLVVGLGGAGTILRGAELAAAAETPVLGVNMGHVGFLAEAEYDARDHTVQLVVDRAYSVEERMTLDVVVTVDGEVV